MHKVKHEIVSDNMRFIQGKKKTDKSGVIMIISEYIV